LCAPWPIPTLGTEPLALVTACPPADEGRANLAGVMDARQTGADQYGRIGLTMALSGRAGHGIGHGLLDGAVDRLDR
jgi:hypothetical protein